MTREAYLKKLLDERILLLDGAMGTMIQKAKLQDEDFSLALFVETTDEERGVAPGCNELLSINRPDIIFDIHKAYLDAGSDIIETNTFCANAFSLEEYGLEHSVYDLNLAACEIARQAVEAAEAEDESRYAFVAGVIGPTSRSLSFSPVVDDPAWRDANPDEFCKMYAQQVRALMDGRVDLLLIETVFDTLVAKTALRAARQVFEERQKQIPIMLSATFSDRSARTLSGQTLEAFLISLEHEDLFSLGLNCSMGAQDMLPLLKTLSAWSPFPTSAHPNAGFPDKNGNYLQSPQEMADIIKPVLEKGWLNIVGGCCGTTPEHIKAIKQILDTQIKPRIVPKKAPRLMLSGLESFIPEGLLVTIGERTNVAGSRKFARLIASGSWDEALQIARSQVEQGAQVLDICMDASLIDAPAAMVTFLRYVASDPAIAKVPIMVDSSDWNVIEAALPELQGRGIVNSISLKEGERVFLERASAIYRAGSAMVVMLFDEQGQADSYERRCEIANRSYTLLVQNGIPATSIIFDPNVLAIATGIDEHDGYAKDFIRATSWIKASLPGVSVSGGISNLSFSFRGNTPLREALHAVFIHHAKQAGLDMAIIDPKARLNLDWIPARALAVCEEAILLSEGDGRKAREALIDLALSDIFKETTAQQVPMTEVWKSLPPQDRIIEAIIRGDETFLREDILALLDQNPEASPVFLVDGPFMEGMSQVGKKFEKGQLFLPQMVRSARTMKQAVDILNPYIERYLKKNTSEVGHHLQKSGTIVMATVKGDVHDIGKNIVTLVLRSNNFEVKDLGVMVSPETILAEAKACKADMVGLSGLITPSLSEMAQVCRVFEDAGMNIPIIVGGATTSQLHTAMKLCPLYSGPVIQTADASVMAATALKLMAKDTREQLLKQINDRYAQMLQEDLSHRYPTRRSDGQMLSYEAALERRFVKKAPAPVPPSLELLTFPQLSVSTLINRLNWNMLAAAWKVPVESREAQKLIADAKALLDNAMVQDAFAHSLRAVARMYPAASDGRCITIYHGATSAGKLNFLRRQSVAEGGTAYSLADYVLPLDENNNPQDYCGLLAVTAGLGLEAVISDYKNRGDEYHAVLLQLIADRFAEAAAAYVHEQMVGSLPGGLTTIRPAPGYPTCPDHSEKIGMFTILEVTKHTGITLTEGLSMNPASSICALVLTGENIRYFSVGKLGEDQLQLYAQEKGVPMATLAKTIQGME